MDAAVHHAISIFHLYSRVHRKTFAALATADFWKLPVVRRLMRLRDYGQHSSQVSPGLAPSPIHRNRDPFLELDVLPQQELVLGIVGRFWRPDGGIVRGLGASDFGEFHSDGYAKAVWNFSLAAVAGGTQLTTETRVQTFGSSATFKFRLYWLLVGPFSGIIRNSMLREIKRIAEQIEEHFSNFSPKP